MREFIKSFVPPILLKNKLRTHLRIKLSKNRWIHGGDYRKIIRFNFEQIKVDSNNVWDCENWTRHVENMFHENNKTPPNFQIRSTLFALKLLYYFDHSKKIKFVDFGGGCGVIMPYIADLSEELKVKIDTCIIDSNKNIVLGKKLLSSKENIIFFDETKFSLTNIFEKIKNDNTTILLNLSGVIKYIHPYKEFLRESLKNKIPDFVCITRFQRCEDSLKDAFTIQDISTEYGYCGSTVVNLFGKYSLINLMKELGYDMLKEKFITIGDKTHFIECEDESFRKITSVAYIFIRSK